MIRASRQLQFHTHRLKNPRQLPSRSGVISEPNLVAGRFFFGYGGSGNSDGKDDSAKEALVVQDGDKSDAISSPAIVGSGESAPRPSPLLILPVNRKPLFPGTVHGLILTNPPIVAAIREMHEKGGNNYAGVFMRKDSGAGTSDDGDGLKWPEVISDPSEIYHTGTLAQIHPATFPLGGGRGGGLLGTGEGGESSELQHLQVFLTLHRRIDFLSVVDAGPPMVGEVRHWAAPLVPGLEGRAGVGMNSKEAVGASVDLVKALSNEVVAVIRDLVRVNPLIREQTQYFTTRVDVGNPYKLADFAAALTTASGTELQAVLEEADAAARLRKALDLIVKEREVSKLQAEIKESTEASLSKTQRDFMLHEQLKAIKKELGVEQDDKEALLAKFKQRVEEAVGMPDTAKKVVDEELAKLSLLERNSAEFNTSRSYLDWLTSLPWGKHTVDCLDVAKAKVTLDADHYGLDDVKDRILEFIAVGKLKGALTGRGKGNGKILCLVGPPGVGKTSIGKSVANALGRKFFRFSVGGLSDVAEIKGHRRTYVGAMPGKPIQSLKETGVCNPLILIDEIDKLGRGHQGDPASALLELLDPSQNDSFSDHFVDTPVDMSQALFLCTANVLDTIPAPLLDRMEVVRIAGYDLPEKVEIAERYLIPNAMHQAGLKPKPTPASDDNAHDDDADGETEKDAETQEAAAIAAAAAAVPAEVAAKLRIDESAVQALVRWHCREAGVRQLAQKIERICRKLALDVVRLQESSSNSPSNSNSSSSSWLPSSSSAAAAQTPSEKCGWVVSEDSLHEFVGQPLFTSDRLYEGGCPAGVVMGLAWTSMGGTSLYIEVAEVPGSPDGSGGRTKGKGATARNGNAMNGGGGFDDSSSGSEQEGGGDKGRGSLMTTGKLGEVMAESSQIAYTLARNFLNHRCVGHQDNPFLANARVHLHVPEGATPKDGPSAGVTMTTALLSLAMDKPTRADMAMTGEVSLTGKVLPVGGIKEKTIAARRAAITCLVLPAANLKDYLELPAYLKEGLEVHFADTYDDVYAVAFSEDPSGVFGSFDP